MNIPNNLKYTKEHEWVSIENDVATIGITDFAQASLGDIVFLEIPEEGTTLALDSAFGVVESIKSVSDLYAPLSGTVIAKNAQLESSPEEINKNPYDAWLIKIKFSDVNQIQKLMDNEQYSTHCQNHS
jgi:glycine cleavage system H protein